MRATSRSGALAAEARGRAGERYLLSGQWASIPDIAAMMEARDRAAGGRGSSRPSGSRDSACRSSPRSPTLTRSQPLYTAPALRALSEHRDCSNAKARRELGFAPRPLDAHDRRHVHVLRAGGPARTGAKRGKSLPAEAFIETSA